MRSSFLWLILAAVIAATWDGAYARATVPGTSWVYPYFDELRLREDTPAFFVMTGPYLRADVAGWLGRGGRNTVFLSRRARWLDRMLRQELGPELTLGQSGDLVVTCEGALSSCLETDRKAKPQVLLTFAAQGKQGLDLWGRFRASANAAREHKTETRPWRENLRASFDYGGIGYTRSAFSLFVGRDEASWGLSRRGGLLLSGSAPSMDMVKASLSTGSFRLTTFHSQLRRGDGDPWDAGVRRYVCGHRLEVVAGKRFNFSLSEVVLYGGEGRTVELGYLNPLAPFYAEQWNSGWEDNILAACDCALLFPGRAEVRCEVMLDDFQVDEGSEPHEVAVGLDVRAVNPLLREWSLVGCSYSLVTNRTYGHRVAWNRFMQEGAVMGYPGGPDGDRLEAWASLALGDPYLVTLGYQLVRRGEGRASDSQAEPAKSLRFPSGVVENAHTLAAELAWHPSYHVRVKAKAAWSRTFNAGNLEDNDDRAATLGLWVEYALRSTRPVAGGGADE